MTDPLIRLGSWALISLSLFNGLALLWLGLTMFLAAEKRQAGLWLILIGMGLGGLFFLSHTTILADQLALAEGISVNGWWRVGWLPIIGAPLVWYALILWYTGFWEDGGASLRWHRYPLTALSIVAALLVWLHVFARPLPSFTQIALLDFSDTILVLGVPLMLLIFPPYAILCVVLPLHVIQHPTPPPHEIGNLARQRARPWLVRTSLMLLAVAVVVAAFTAYVVVSAQQLRPTVIYTIFVLPIIGLDLGVTGVIAGAIVALGKAVTAYEIFTGKTLPRRGFARQWYTALGLAALIASFIGYCLVFHAQQIYALVILAGIAVISYAVLSWRTFVYQEQSFANLRPFVSGQSLLQNLVNPEHDTLAQAQQLFEAVCERFLATARAQITPDATLSLLVSAPLVYPEREALAVTAPLGDTIQQLDPNQYPGFQWVIPLWSERGRIGVMLLGEKTGGGLYTEEEMQIAQAAGERILDMFAGEIMAQHFVRLQRRRMTEQRVMDFQTRRLLHDKTLPMLHEAILSLSSAEENKTQEVIRTLSLIHKGISNLIHTTPDLLFAENNNDFWGVIRGSIQNEFASEFEHITWQLPDNAPVVANLTADILYGALREAVRNAAIHGRGDNPKRALSLWITVQCGETLQMSIRDDGRGWRADSQPNGGSGGGLALHGTLMALIGGSLTIEAAEDGGTIVKLAV